MSIPHVKADTSEAKVLSYSWYVAPDDTLVATPGDLVVVGEIQNVGSNVLGEVVVSGYAFNSTGSLINTGEAEAFGTNLNPGQNSPFYIDFIPDPTAPIIDPNWAYSITNVTVFVSYVVDSNTTNNPDLIVPTGDVSASLDASGIYTLSGFIQNTGTQPSGQVWVVSTFYNASGTVVSLNYTDYISDSISPGAKAMFLATPVDSSIGVSSSITNYSVLVESTPFTATPTPTPTQTTTQPTATTTASTNPLQSPTPISLGTLIDSVIAVVVVIVIILAIVGLLFIRKHKKTEKLDLPPPPPPE